MELKIESVIVERLQRLRMKMKEMQINWYLIPTADFHNSEYVSDYFKTREYFSGFTGSSGTLLVSEDMAGLWTDGRYFIQAEKELDGTGIQLFRMMEEHVPDIKEYLKTNLKEKDVLLFDGRVVTAGFGLELEKITDKKQAEIKYEEDFIKDIFIERTPLSSEAVVALEDAITGESVSEKLERVKEKMGELSADTHILSKLDDIMWLFNIRGNDIPCNPVSFSYAVIEKEQVSLFLQPKAVTEEVKALLSKEHIVIKDYEDILLHLEGMSKHKKILIDQKNINYTIYKNIKKNHMVINGENPTNFLKAIKNETEQRNMREVYLKDSVAVTKFIYWVKKNIGKNKITEEEAAAYLDSLRKQITTFMDLSFDTISAYRENAAMMHYKATKENAKVLAEEGMLLVDSGGQYVGGTTDVTRTIVLGPVSDREKQYFTLVCKGMMDLSNARFLYGCTGRNIDILAREPLWKLDMDYKCGTGHGIGYMLNVHEGPQGVRWKYNKEIKETPLEEGMVISNEPGVYIENEFGIRTENVILCKKGNKNEYGQFMHFETLTYVPIDLEAIDVSYLEVADISKINQYHKDVFLKISPFLEK